MESLETPEHKMKWFEGFLYIFNSHWDKVDNFRIDKYLMFLRFMFSQVLLFVKSADYAKNHLTWYQKSIFRVFKQ